MFYYQKNGELLTLTDKKWINENHYYRYGSLNKEPYYSENIPKCNLCGHELNIMKKGKVGLILSCTNSECQTNKVNKRCGDIKLKAFLPTDYYNKIKEKRKENHKSYYDIEYLTSVKGLTKEEAIIYIEEHKNSCGRKNKGHNKEYFIKKYGEEYTENYRKRSHLCVEYWLENGLTEEEAKKKISENQSKYSKQLTTRPVVSRSEMIKKIGEKETNKFFRERSILCTEYWIKRGYSYDDAKKKISEIQLANSKLVKKHYSDRTLEFWLKNGYDEDYARKKISELQKTFSKEKCIERYGEEEGIKRWKERQNKWQETLHKTGNLHVGYSNVSQELFNEILSHYNKDNIDYVFYGSKNHEYSLRDDDVNYIYDFTDLEKRKIIEFQGDIYHGNPELFTENEHPNPFKKDKTCKDLWEFDNKKVDVAIKNNFEILRIWEKEYRENKKETINKCLKFLNDE